MRGAGLLVAGLDAAWQYPWAIAVLVRLAEWGRGAADVPVAVRVNVRSATVPRQALGAG